jgi:hypothetical protein
MSVAVGLGFQASQAKFSAHFSTRMDCLKGRVHTRRRQGTRRISESEVLKERGRLPIGAGKTITIKQIIVQLIGAWKGILRTAFICIFYLQLLHETETKNTNHYSLDGLLQRHIFHFKISCQKKRHSRCPTQKNEY